ncbi:porin [Marinomonas sp. TI.3.20]|uniref:porin n=1 Tax=Marinomonas sp. TI.3.20 TaxID=3121296 RepID=UPI00311DE283
MWGLADAHLKTDNSSLNITGRAKFTASHTDSGGLPGFSSRLGANGQVQNNDGVSAFFNVGWEMQSTRDTISSNVKGGADNIKSRYIFVGLGSKTLGKITLGQNDTPFYTMVTSTTDIPYYNSMEASANTYGYDFAPNLALYSNKFGKLSVEASYQFKTVEGGSSNNGDVLDYYDAGLTSANFKTQNNAYSAGAIYSLNDHLNVHAGYAYQTFMNDATKADYGFALDYTINNLYLGAVYTYSKEDDGTNSANHKGAEVTASYSMNQYTFDTSYAYGKQKSDISGQDKTYAKAINVDVVYAVFSNVNAAVGISHVTTGKNEYYTSLNYSF